MGSGWQVFIMATLTERRMDEIMGRLLQTGVILAAMLVLAGGVVYVTRYPTLPTDYRVFQGEPERLRTVPGIIHGAITLDGLALIQLGLLVLIATPIARVAFSVVAFLYQRDWIYVAVTLIVLGILFYSLLGGQG
jgi:uncharacterized membrane protein